MTNKIRWLFALIAVTGCPILAGAQKPAPSADTGRTVVSLPDKQWGVQIDLSGFAVKSNGVQQDGRSYLLAENDKTHVTVSATLEKGDSGQPSTGCKEIMQARVTGTPQSKVAGFEKKNVKIWQSEDRTFMEYLIPTLKGPGGTELPINQINRFLCLVHDNVFVDLHASKVDFHPSDEKLIAAVLDSVQIRDEQEQGQAQTQTSLGYFKTGSARFMANDFKGAISPYAQALALEQKERKLDKQYWYVLVDSLGMAYGITGDLEAARRTFEYGIQEDPAYPLFYYEMADYYGEKNDAQNATAYLKMAYERRANMIPGEKLPDPRADDSFKELLKNKEFRDFADSLAKNP